MNKDKIQIEKNLENSNSNINNLNNQNMESNSGSFLINAQTLEELMGAYKERGLENRDLQFISKLGGIEEILKKLRTSSKKGISSLEDRINDFGSNKVFIEPTKVTTKIANIILKPSIQSLLGSSPKVAPKII